MTDRIQEGSGHEPQPWMGPPAEAHLMSDGVATAVWFLAIEPARAHRILDRHRADDDGRCPICRHRSNPCPDCQLSGWALRALDVAETRLVWDPDADRRRAVR